MATPDSERLTMTSRPWFGWLAALIFTAAGLYMLLSQERAVVPGLLMLAFGVVILLVFGKATALTLDRMTGTVTLRQSGLRPSTNSMPLTDVTGAVVQSYRSSTDNTVTYRVALVLRTGGEMPLSTIYSSGQRDKEAQASRINDFLGTKEPRPAAMGSVQGFSAEPQVTDGVTWHLETITGTDGSPVTRWHSEGAPLEDGFLLVLRTLNKGSGVSAGGGLLNTLARQSYAGIFRMYGFDPSELVGLQQAVSVEGQDPILAEHFMTFTSQPDGSRRWLAPDVCRLLADWAEHHPAAVVGGSELSNIAVVAAPRGIWISVMGNTWEPAAIEDLSRLGTALVHAQPATAAAAGA